MSGTKGKFLIQPLNLVGLESLSPWHRAVTDSRGFAHLLSSSPSAELKGGDTGSRLGYRVPGTSALTYGAGAAPSLARVPMASLLGAPQDAPDCGWGKENRQESYFLAHARGLGKGQTQIGKGQTQTAGSDSTADPHSLGPAGFLTSHYHPQCCQPCFHQAMAHPHP